MKVNEFIEKLKHIASLPTTYYSVSGGQWAKWNGRSWNFDCVILVKAVLWGWCEDKNALHGGANYGSNGVYDDGADTIMKRCKNISTDFSNIKVGELLHMNGHVGIYIGNRQVIECTAAWEGKVLYSQIGLRGERSRNGVRCGNWINHGELLYLEGYENIPVSISTNKKDVIYQVYTDISKWLPNVKNYCNYSSDGYAGIFGQAISGFRANIEDGKLIYCVRTLNDKWLGEIINREKEAISGDDFAGILGKPIDAIMIKSTNGTARYRVKLLGEKDYLPWVTGYNKNDSENGYAGIFGRKIDAIQVEVI